MAQGNVIATNKQQGYEQLKNKEISKGGAQITLTPYDQLEALQDQNRYYQVVRMLDFKRRISGDMHGNTLLLTAIADNEIETAVYLLTICNKKQIDLPDTFPTSKSTPLILAAKTGANAIAMLLIGLGAKVNNQDYRGYTALHYACLYRNNDLITALLQSGADINVKNVFGDRPIDYYEIKIEDDDISYAYGYNDKSADKLRIHWDWNTDFYGTKKRFCHALRWFLAHIIVNFNIGTTLIHKNNNRLCFFYQGKISLPENISIFALAKNHVKKPIFDAHFYENASRAFCEWRNGIRCDDEIKSQLETTHYRNRGSKKLSQECLIL